MILLYWLVYFITIIAFFSCLFVKNYVEALAIVVIVGVISLKIIEKRII